MQVLNLNTVIKMGLIIGIGDTKPVFPYDYCYGIEWDVTVSNPQVKRIGKLELHRELPIQNKMYRVLLNDAGKEVYRLHPNDSTKRDNGAKANLDGTDGQVMVNLPKFYYRVEMEGNIRRLLISEYPLPGFKLSPECYESAFEASLDRKDNKLSSVVNTTADYRGGNNNADWDEADNTLLGRPATNVSQTSFRTYANNRGGDWYQELYHVYKKWFWLYFIEYAHFNCQLAFNPEPTAEGFKQGGLGEGVTTLSDSGWSSFSRYNPFIPCGHTNSLGNKTGVVTFDMPESYGSKLAVEVPSYRGIENPFGHIWAWTDGCKMFANSAEDGGESLFYVADNPKDSNSSSTIDGYSLRGSLARTEGYIKELVLGEYADIMPLSVGGGSTTYHCDRFYTNAETSHGLRGVLFGGAASSGSPAGLACSHAHNAPSSASALLGSRLCFYKGVE